MSERPTPETDSMAARWGYPDSTIASVYLTKCTELERQRDEWKERFIAFASVHCAEYGRDHYGENCLHFTHYDLLQEAGARMVDFKRCEEVKE